MAKKITSAECGATLDVETLINLLGSTYTKLIKNKKPITSFPSIMLWGQPGVGKSQAVRQIGEYISKNTDKTVDITDVRLLLFNPIDRFYIIHVE